MRARTYTSSCVTFVNTRKRFHQRRRSRFMECKLLKFARHWRPIATWEPRPCRRLLERGIKYKALNWSRNSRWNRRPPKRIGSRRFHGELSWIRKALACIIPVVRTALPGVEFAHGEAFRKFGGSVASPYYSVRL